MAAELFKTDAELRAYLKVNAAFESATLADSILAVRHHITTVLSTTEYAALLAAYNASPGTALPAKYATLLPYVQEALARLALWHFSLDNLEASNAGFFTNSGKEQRKTPWQWQLNDTRTQLRYDAFNAVEKILHFLWDNWATSVTSYTLWYVSAEREATRKLFINSSKEFSLYYNIGQSYELYCKLNTAHYHVDRAIIQPIISPELYDQIKTQISTNTVTGANTTLLTDFIQPAAAYLTIAHGIDENATTFTELGLVEQFDSERQTQRASLPARTELLARRKKTALEKGQLYLTTLANYLYANAASYPLFLASDTYDAMVTQRSTTTKQTRGFFVVR